MRVHKLACVIYPPVWHRLFSKEQNFTRNSLSYLRSTKSNPPNRLYNLCRVWTKAKQLMELQSIESDRQFECPLSNEASSESEFVRVFSIITPARLTTPIDASLGNVYTDCKLVLPHKTDIDYGDLLETSSIIIIFSTFLATIHSQNRIRHPKLRTQISHT